MLCPKNHRRSFLCPWIVRALWELPEVDSQSLIFGSVRKLKGMGYFRGSVQNRSWFWIVAGSYFSGCLPRICQPSIRIFSWNRFCPVIIVRTCQGKGKGLSSRVFWPLAPSPGLGAEQAFSCLDYLEEDGWVRPWCWHLSSLTFSFMNPSRD